MKAISGTVSLILSHLLAWGCTHSAVEVGTTAQQSKADMHARDKEFTE